jgi:hypothetical protein
MKIATLYASNVMRLTLAEISLDGKSLTVSGNNEQGKSSLVDSFLIALGGKKATPDKVITEGQTKTEIYLNLTEEFRIEKVITADKTELKVRPLNDETASYGSPQDICDKLFGTLTFDPLGFGKLKPAEQIDILKKFLPEGNQLDKIEQDILLKYSSRTDVNKDLKKNELTFKSMKEPNLNLPNTEISVANLSKQLTELTTGRSNKLTKKTKIESLVNDIVNIKDQIKILEESLIKIETVLKITQEEFAQMPVYDLQIKTLTDQIETAEETNKAIRYRNDYAKAENAAGDAKIKSDQLTMAIEELRQEKLKIFASAKMPVEGLIFGEEGVLLNNIPYEQLSESRKLMTSMKIGMTLNPKLKVMFTKHGNDFDDDRIRELFEMVETDGYQLIVERINPVDGLPYVIIDDGRITKTSLETKAVPHSKKTTKSKEDIL